MDDLIAFLKARLDEDEAAARDQRFVWPANFEVTLNPARVLREVGAKRRILAEVKDLIDRMDAQIEQEWGTGLGPSGESDLLLKLLALPYSDHPDYRLEWAP